MARVENEPTHTPPPPGYGARLAACAALAVVLLLAPIVLARDPFASLAALLGLVAGVWAVFLVRAVLARDALLLLQGVVELLSVGGAVWVVAPSIPPLAWGHAGLFAAGIVPTASALADAWRSGVLAPLDAGREGLTARQWIVPWVRSRPEG